MSNQQIAEQIADNYLSRLSEGDLDGVASLYAEDATLEDPVGSEPIVGRAAIAEFYKFAISMNVKLQRTGPVRCAANEMVFPFICHSYPEGAQMKIEIIDHFTLDDNNLITKMRAFWSEANIS